MRNNRIGRQIEYLRKEKKITQRELCRGILQETAYYRFVKGEQYPDYMTLSRIYARRGKSVNKLEVLCDINEYELCKMQEEMESKLEHEELRSVQKLLAKYKTSSGTRKKGYKQYIKMMEGILLKEQKCNSNMVESYFYEALKMTLPIEEVEDIRTVVLDDVEIELLLSIIEEHRIQKKKIAEYEIRYFMRYIEKLRWDEEYLVNIYPKVAGVQIQI